MVEHEVFCDYFKLVQVGDTKCMGMFLLLSGSCGFDVKNTRFSDVRPTCPQNLKI